jgi:hypothetical protein
MHIESLPTRNDVEPVLGMVGSLGWETRMVGSFVEVRPSSKAPAVLVSPVSYKFCGIWLRPVYTKLTVESFLDLDAIASSMLQAWFSEIGALSVLPARDDANSVTLMCRLLIPSEISEPAHLAEAILAAAFSGNDLKTHIRQIHGETESRESVPAAPAAAGPLVGASPPPAGREAPRKPAPLPPPGSDFPRAEDVPGVFVEHFDISPPFQAGGANDGIIYHHLFLAARDAAAFAGWGFRSYSSPATPGTMADWSTRQIRAFPAVILFRDGVELGRHTVISNSVEGILRWAYGLLGIEGPLPAPQAAAPACPPVKNTMPIRVDATPEAAALRAAVERCFVSGEALEVVYFGGSLPGGSRLLTPLRYCPERGDRYIIARCHRDGGDKTFRLDRMHLPGLPLVHAPGLWGGRAGRHREAPGTWVARDRQERGRPRPQAAGPGPAARRSAPQDRASPRLPRISRGFEIQGAPIQPPAGPRARPVGRTCRPPPRSARHMGGA